MVSRTRNGGFFGFLGALIGAAMGYRQAAEIGMSPLQGALILGALGFLVGSVGGFLLRTIGSIAMYVVLIGAMAFIFREQISALVGLDPASSAMTLWDDVASMFSS